MFQIARRRLEKITSRRWHGAWGSGVPESPPSSSSSSSCRSPSAITCDQEPFMYTLVLMSLVYIYIHIHTHTHTHTHIYIYIHIDTYTYTIHGWGRPWRSRAGRPAWTLAACPSSPRPPPASGARGEPCVAAPSARACPRPCSPRARQQPQSPDKNSRNQALTKIPEIKH